MNLAAAKPPESIGYLEAVSIGVGGMVGGGIFVVLGLPGNMVQGDDDPGLLLLLVGASVGCAFGELRAGSLPDLRGWLRAGPIRILGVMALVAILSITLWWGSAHSMRARAWHRLGCDRMVSQILTDRLPPGPLRTRRPATLIPPAAPGSRHEDRARQPRLGLPRRRPG